MAGNTNFTLIKNTVFEPLVWKGQELIPESEIQNVTRTIKKIWVDKDPVFNIANHLATKNFLGEPKKAEKPENGKKQQPKNAEIGPTTAMVSTSSTASSAAPKVLPKEAEKPTEKMESAGTAEGKRSREFRYLHP